MEPEQEQGQFQLEHPQKKWWQHLQNYWRHAHE
jgi:hypothetical protein